MTASFKNSAFMEQIPVKSGARSIGGRAAPILVSALWNRRVGYRWDAADIRRAGELTETECRNEGRHTLVRCRLTGYGGRALTGKGIDVFVGADGGVGGVETVRQG